MNFPVHAMRGWRVFLRNFLRGAGLGTSGGTIFHKSLIDTGRGREHNAMAQSRIPKTICVVQGAFCRPREGYIFSPCSVMRTLPKAELTQPT